MDVRGAARPGKMTFTRLSTVMNTLLWVSREVQGEVGRGRGWGAAERFWWMEEDEDYFCLASANSKNFPVLHFNKSLYMSTT